MVVGSWGVFLVPSHPNVALNLFGSDGGEGSVGRSRLSTQKPTTDRRLGVVRIPGRSGTARRAEQVRSKQ